jgi:hypothetical protein
VLLRGSKKHRLTKYKERKISYVLGFVKIIDFYLKKDENKPLKRLKCYVDFNIE